MGKTVTGQGVPFQSKVQGGREGENPDAASPSEARPRNSSGAASVAASILDLREKVNRITEVLVSVCTALGDTESVEVVKRIRQQGYRHGR